MLKCYIDESEQKDETGHVLVYTVAAVVLSERDDKSHNTQWTEVLNNFGLELFHAVDAENLRKEFRQWSARQREDLFKSLLPIIRGTVSYISAAALSPRALKGLPDLLRHHLNNPYTMCLQECVEDALHWGREHNSKVDFIIEEQKNNSANSSVAQFFDTLTKFGDSSEVYVDGVARDLVRWKGSSTIFPKTSPDAVGLHAADWLAYELGKEAKQEYIFRLGEKRRATRWLLTQLVDRPHNLHFYATVESLLAKVPTELGGLAVGARNKD